MQVSCGACGAAIAVATPGSAGKTGSCPSCGASLDAGTGARRREGSALPPGAEPLAKIDLVVATLPAVRAANVSGSFRSTPPQNRRKTDVRTRETQPSAVGMRVPEPPALPPFELDLGSSANAYSFNNRQNVSAADDAVHDGMTNPVGISAVQRSSLDDDFASPMSQPEPVPEPSALPYAYSPEPSRSYRPSSVSSRPMRTASAKPRVSRGGALGLAFVLIAVALVGVGWFVLKPAFFNAAPKAPKATTLPVLQERLTAWHASHSASPLGSTAAELAQGIRLMKRGTDEGYVKAAAFFERALLANPGNLAAAARWVEVRSEGRADAFSAADRNFAMRLVDEVLAVDANLAVARRAKVQLLIAEGHLDSARNEIRRIVEPIPTEEKAETLLVEARVFLEQNAAVSLEKIEAAIAMDPTLVVAQFELGRAAESVGRLAMAVRAYEKRLEADPLHADTLRALAFVYLRVGDYVSAKALLTRFDGLPDRHIGVYLKSAILFAEGDLPKAEASIAKGIALPGGFPEERIEIQVLGAQIARQRGAIGTAKERAASAIEVDPQNAPAHFQLLLIALDQGDATAARASLAACAEGMKHDKALYAELLGRVEALAGDWRRAAAAFRVAVEQAPARLGPYIAGAAALMRAGDETASLNLMHKALSLNPTQLCEAPWEPSPFWSPPADTIKNAKGAFKRGGALFWPDVYEGVISWHLGEVASAKHLFGRALDADRTSYVSLLYSGVIELDRRRFKEAMKFALRSQGADVENAVAFYIEGAAFEGSGDRNRARTSMLEAIKRNPRLVPANIRLGMMALADGRQNEARDYLRAAVAEEPFNMEARRGLFSLGY